MGQVKKLVLLDMYSHFTFVGTFLPVFALQNFCHAPLVSFSCANASLPTEEFIYRVDDSPESVEAAEDGEHMLDGVCDGGQLFRKEKQLV